MNNTIKDVNGNLHRAEDLKQVVSQDVWFPIKGYPNYEISQLGNVKSIGRVIKTSDGREYNKPERVWKGQVDSNGYYATTIVNEFGARSIRIHQLMAIVFYNHIPNGNKNVCDHINAVKLDNHLSNIQIVSQRENLTKDAKEGTSKYVGVYFNKSSKKWVARIRIGSKRYHLGAFTDEDEAGEAYNTALYDWETYEINPKQRLAFNNITK